MGAAFSTTDERLAPMLDNAHGTGAPLSAADDGSTSTKTATGAIIHAQLATHERMVPAYELIITSAAVLGGFSINAALETITESDFGNQAAFDSYAVLLVASSVLDLYAMVTLVFNIYMASRAQALSASELHKLEALGAAGDVDTVTAALARLEPRSARRRAEFVHNSRAYRSSAVVAFLVSLPCFLGALAAKQFSVQPRRHAPRVSSPLLRLAAASAGSVAPPPPAMEPFTPIRWSLAILVVLGTCAVLLAVLGQIRLLRELRRTEQQLGCISRIAARTSVSPAVR